ncbi:39177_t:CDS:1, partial [Gigaspora margarita]
MLRVYTAKKQSKVKIPINDSNDNNTITTILKAMLLVNDSNTTILA